MPLMGFLGRLAKWFKVPDLGEEERSVESTSEEIVEPEYQDYQNAWWVPDGEPVMQADASTEDIQIDERLYRRLVGALDDPKLELPQVPEIARQALFMLRDADTSFKRVSEVVKQDPVLTAEFLRLANSVAYRGFTEIRELEQALARVGQREAKRIVVASTTKNIIIRVSATDRTIGQELWECSLASAALLQQLAPRYGLPPDTAFLVGLLHDIGKLGVLNVVHAYQRESKQRVSRSVFDRLCSERHEHLGIRISEAWQLPDPIPELAGSHHKPPRDDDPLEAYRLLIGLTDVVCAMQGFSQYVPYDFFALECIQRLHIENDEPTRQMLAEWPALLSDAVDLY